MHISARGHKCYIFQKVQIFHHRGSPDRTRPPTPLPLNLKGLISNLQAALSARFDWWRRTNAREPAESRTGGGEERERRKTSSCLGLGHRSHASVVLGHGCPDAEQLDPRCSSFSSSSLPPAQAIRKRGEKINGSLSVHCTSPNGCTPAPETFSKLLTIGMCPLKHRSRWKWLTNCMKIHYYIDLFSWKGVWFFFILLFSFSGFRW